MADGSVQRSSLKEFLASIATIKGDLSNITAPPFVLADKSTTELPRYWIEHPDLFCAPAAEQTPERRMLAVLKWFLGSLKAQQYAGREPSEGVKKPLNAFLGEVFLGSCSGGGDGAAAEGGETTLVAEQVSHHPPVTACYLFNDAAGVRAEGYTRQEITFTGTGVNIRQNGHAVLTLDAWGEEYLIPLPDVSVKGILTAGPYPELSEQVAIVGSNGLVAEVEFSGKKMLGLGGKKNRVEAGIYRVGDEKRKEALFTASGSWSESFAFCDAEGKEIDRYDVLSAPSAEFRTRPLERQDPWESRKAWAGVIEALHRGDMKGVAEAKDELESAQRELRKREEFSEEKWRAVFFRQEEVDERAERLLRIIGQGLESGRTVGCWRFEKGSLGKVRGEGTGGLREGVTPFG